MSTCLRLIALILLLGLTLPGHAARLNAIVSEYSAAEFAAAAGQFRQSYPAHRISARTPEQLAELDEAGVRAWLAEGDLLFGVGLFGPEAERLAPLLAEWAGGERFVLHSEQALVTLSRTRQGPVFASREQAQALGAE